jgi:sirohydrochlorin cobaltochelatase
MPAGENLKILLAPYGTLYPPALSTYSRIQESYERMFPGCPIRLAFTSALMRKRLQEKEGISILSLQNALEELSEEGAGRVVVQSLQIISGSEFHQMATWAADQKRRMPGSSCLEIGLPLLSSLQDCRSVSSLVPSFFRENAIRYSPEKETVVLVGHGTGHPADALYSLLHQILREEHGNVFLATIEGFYGIDSLLADLRGSGARMVRLLPFLLVAGGHAENDIFGPGPESIKSILEKKGYEVVADRRGLGDREEAVSLFLGHTRDALEKTRCAYSD